MCSFISKVLFLLYILSFTILVRSDLPTYSGQYGVGTINLEVPITLNAISSYIVNSTGQPAFKPETVFFSLYYPADKINRSTKANHPWLPPPVDLLAQGFSRFTNGSVDPQLVLIGLQSLAGAITIPAQVDVPLYGNASKFPLLIFSHGDATIPTFYSQYCGELASRGNIVAAIEHRDGSGAGSVVLMKDGTSRNVSYFTADQLSPPVNNTEFKLLQQTLRQTEVNETIRILHSVNDGNGEQVHNNSSRGEGRTLSDWASRFDFDMLLFAGHSFGANTVLDILEVTPSPDIPTKGAITLDPGKDSGPLNTAVKVPILIPDSQEWSSEPTIFYGQQHFDVVKGIAETALNTSGAGWFMTLLGTSHSSVTDAGLIAGRTLLGFFDSGSTNATIEPLVGILQYVGVSQDFIDFLKNGNRNGILASNVTDPEYVVKPNTTTPTGNDLQYWEIHEAPPTNASSTGPAPTSTSTHKNSAAFLSNESSLLLLSLLVVVVCW